MAMMLLNNIITTWLIIARLKFINHVKINFKKKMSMIYGQFTRSHVLFLL